MNKIIIRCLMLLFLALGCYGQAQSKSGTAITHEGDTIAFTYPKDNLDKFIVSLGLKGDLPNGERIRIKLKKHKEFTVDTMVFKTIKPVRGFPLFMEEEAKGRINLYTHRFISTTTNSMTNTPATSFLVYYYLLNKDGSTTRILKGKLRRKPEIYFKDHPDLMAMLTGTKKDYDKLPKIIAKYNTEHPL